MPHVCLDLELIGQTFLAVAHTVESQRTRRFWLDDRQEFLNLWKNPNITWVTFNGNSFDMPIVQAWLAGHPNLKGMANDIIELGLQPWQTRDRYDLPDLPVKHIDLKETAPGVMISLKTYAGRMHFPTLQDLPFDHTADISNDPKALDLLALYCENDCKVTEQLFRILKEEIELREQMGQQYGLELRSKSGAQVAHAILKKVCDIPRRTDDLPVYVSYTRPDFIRTDNPDINRLIDEIESHRFQINQDTGAVVFPEFLKEPFRLNDGIYKLGIGGIHSQHDVKLHIETSDEMSVTDADCGAFYPHLIVNAGLIPDIPNADKFMATYRSLLGGRMTDKKRLGEVNKRIAEIEKELSK